MKPLLETLLTDVGFLATVTVATFYVYGYKETVAFFRSIPRLRLRLRVRIPDSIKHDMKALSRVHPMDRTFNDACDW